MEVEILGADSLGVRSMCCRVKTNATEILLDPGVALGPQRFQLPPHPLEIEAAANVSAQITAAAGKANIIVISHFHHDHFTPFYQHEYTKVKPDIYAGKRLFIKSYLEHINTEQKKRAQSFVQNFSDKEQPQLADGREFGEIYFSPAFPHGEEGRIFVIMTAIREGGTVFVHSSDIQSVPEDGVGWLLAQKPEVAFVCGPPIYLPQFLPPLRERAQKNIFRMAQAIPLLIVDHHLLRGLDYVDLLTPAKEIAARAKHKLVVAAEYMGQPLRLLEAKRNRLYQDSPGANPAEHKPKGES